MAFNTIQASQVFQSKLDEVIIDESTTGWMDRSSEKFIQYDGGDTVMIADLVMGGLADYDREKGYKRGKLALKFTPYKLTQDRGRSFVIDAMTVNESNFLASAATAMGEFQRTMVVPEVDAYRYSKIAKEAISNNRASFGYTPTEETIFKKLMEDITKVQEEIGSSEKLVITMPLSIANVFYNSDKAKNLVNTNQFNRSELNTTIKSINGIEIKTPPSKLMKTDYKFSTGNTGDEEGGFEATSTAKSINWIIAAESSVVAVNKLDAPRIFTPEQNLDAYAWKFDYRRFHDLWVLKNKLPGLWVNIKENS